MMTSENFAKKIESMLDTENKMFPSPDYGVPWQNLIKTSTKLERFLCWTLGHKWKITEVDDNTDYHLCKRCHDQHLITSFGPFEVGPFITGKL